MLAATPRVLIGEVPTGSRIALSSPDHQHRHIYWFAEYEPEVTSLVHQVIKPGSVFFDVGANVGYFTLLARDLGASVHAFEPNPVVRALLERSLSFDDQRVVVVAAACSDQPGTVALYYQDPRNTGMASVEKVTATKVDVAATTLSDYWRATGVAPDLIKIDVEGHEYKALLGAGDVIESVHPDLVVEVTEHRTVDWLVRRGYAAHTLGARGPQPVDDTLSFENGFVNMYFSAAA